MGGSVSMSVTNNEGNGVGRVGFSYGFQTDGEEEDIGEKGIVAREGDDGENGSLSSMEATLMKLVVEGKQRHFIVSYEKRKVLKTIVGRMEEGDELFVGEWIMH